MLQVKSACLRSSRATYSEYASCIDLSVTEDVDDPPCTELPDCRVTDLDGAVVNGVTDDEWCSSDKENDTVFPFHHTASVVAMERIFAKQRLPNFVRPRGYISPLRCPTLLRSAPLASHVSLTNLCQIPVFEVALFYTTCSTCLQCFDTVAWVASGT